MSHNIFKRLVQKTPGVFHACDAESNVFSTRTGGYIYRDHVLDYTADATFMENHPFLEAASATAWLAWFFITGRSVGDEFLKSCGKTYALWEYSRYWFRDFQRPYRERVDAWKLDHPGEDVPRELCFGDPCEASAENTYALAQFLETYDDAPRFVFRTPEGRMTNFYTTRCWGHKPGRYKPLVFVSPSLARLTEAEAPRKIYNSGGRPELYVKGTTA